MNAPLAEIKNRINEGNIKQALSLVEKLENEGLLHPAVLVWKACCIQLDDENSRYPPSEIENSFDSALAIDPDFIPGIIELAWFYLNVLDDAGRALPLFEKAISLERKSMTEAIVGKAKCLVEIESGESALSYLREVGTRCSDSDELEKARQEIKNSESPGPPNDPDTV